MIAWRRQLEPTLRHQDGNCHIHTGIAQGVFQRHAEIGTVCGAKHVDRIATARRARFLRARLAWMEQDPPSPDRYASVEANAAGPPALVMINARTLSAGLSIQCHGNIEQLRNIIHDHASLLESRFICCVGACQRTGMGRHCACASAGTLQLCSTGLCCVTLRATSIKR